MTVTKQPAKDPYKILGVERGATRDEIHAAYVKMARKYHPDMHPPGAAYAEEMFKEVASAYEVLSDEALRSRYDQGAASTVSNPRKDVKREPVDIDPRVLSMIQTQEKGARRRRGPYSYVSISADEMTHISFTVLLFVVGISFAIIVSASNHFAGWVLLVSACSLSAGWVAASMARRHSKNSGLWFGVVTGLVCLAFVAVYVF